MRESGRAEDYGQVVGAVRTATPQEPDKYGCEAVRK